MRSVVVLGRVGFHGHSLECKCRVYSRGRAARTQRRTRQLSGDTALCSCREDRPPSCYHACRGLALGYLTPFVPTALGSGA